MKRNSLLLGGWMAVCAALMLWTAHPVPERVQADGEEPGVSCQLVVDPQTGKWSASSSDGSYVAESDQSVQNPKIKACMNNAMDVRAKTLRLLALAASLSVAIAFGMIVYGGYLYLTSGGNQKQIDAAKKQLFYTAIGCFIISCAYMIVKFYMDAFGG